MSAARNGQPKPRLRDGEWRHVTEWSAHSHGLLPGRNRRDKRRIAAQMRRREVAQKRNERSQ